MAPRNSLRTAGRAVRAMAITGAIVELLYVVAVNVFLSTSLFDRVVDATPESVDIHFERGWSVFPTRVYARKLSIRGADSHLEWMLRLDRVDFECSLLALLHREFRVTSVQGDGISFRARFKVASPEAIPENTQFLPPITSLGPVGLIPDEVEYAGKWDDKSWHLWTVSIANADARHVREVWIENARFAGETRIRGGFFLKPIRSVEVGPLTIETSNGKLAIKSKVASEHVNADVSMEVKRFDPRTTSGEALLSMISISAAGTLSIPNLGDVGLTPPDGVEVGGAVSVPQFTVRIEKGALRDGSQVDARASDVRLIMHERAASVGVAKIGARIDGGALSARATMEDVGSTLSIYSTEATIAVDSRELGLAHPLDDLHAVFTVADAELRDAKLLQANLFPSTAMRVVGGTVRGSMEVEAWRRESKVRGSASLRGTGMRMLAGAVDVAADVSLEASVGSFRWDTMQASDAQLALLVGKGILEKRGTSDAPRMRVAGLHAFARFSVEDGEARGTVDASSNAVHLQSSFGRAQFAIAAHAAGRGPVAPRGAIELDEAKVDLSRIVVSAAKASSGLSIEHIAASVQSPTFRVSDPLRDMGLKLDVGGARLEDPAALAGLLPPWMHLTVGNGGATLEASARAHVTGRVVRGDAEVAVRGLGVTTPSLHVAGDVRAKIALTDGNEKTVAGNVSLTSARLEGGFDAGSRTPDFTIESLSIHAASKELQFAHPRVEAVDYDLEVGGAELVDARALNNFLPSSDILAIESGHAHATVGLSSDSKGARGHVELQLVHGGLILGDAHFKGELGLSLKARRGGFDATRLDLEGTELAMNDVQVTGASTDTSRWSGDLMVESGHVSLSLVPRLDAELVLRARDANPILAALFQDTLSHTVAGLTHMPSLVIVTHLAVDPHQLVVSDLMATGGDLSLRGTYAVRSKRAGGSTGAFVLHKGPWSVGVDVDSLGSHLRLFGLDGWYQGRAAKVTLAP